MFGCGWRHAEIEGTAEVDQSGCSIRVIYANMDLRADDNFCRIWVFVCLRPTVKDGPAEARNAKKRRIRRAKKRRPAKKRSGGRKRLAIEAPPHKSHGYTLGRRPLQVRRVSKVSRRTFSELAVLEAAHQSRNAAGSKRKFNVCQDPIGAGCALTTGDVSFPCKLLGTDKFSLNRNWWTPDLWQGKCSHFAGVLNLIDNQQLIR